MITLYKQKVGLTPPIDYVPVTEEETYALGEAIKLASGTATKCSGTTKPAYICVGVITQDGMLPVIEVQPYMEFETTLSAAPGEGVTLSAGQKVTISADGLEVTATTTSGVAEIVRIDGQTVGSTVVVKF